MSLRRRLLRLAYEQEDLRPHLLPLVLKRGEQDKVALRKRNFTKLMAKGGKFGVISAYGPGSKKQNKIRHGELMADLQRMGYRKIDPLRGSWEGVTEKSVMVRDMTSRDLFNLGRKYKQDAVIYKSKDGVVGMYYTKGPARAEVAVDVKGDPAFEVATDPSLYSKARGLSFEFGVLWGQHVPWDGVTPISRKELQRMLATGELRGP